MIRVKHPEVLVIAASAWNTSAWKTSAWKATVAVGLCAVAGYFLLPDVGAMDAGYSLIGFSSVVAVVIGGRRHPQGERGPWYALAAGNLGFVLGDGVYDVYQFVLHRSPPFPSVADAFYLGGYPLLIIGLAQLTGRAQWKGRMRERYADAGIVSIGALALLWHVLVGSYAHDPGYREFARIVVMAYPIMDLGVLFIVVQGLVASRQPVVHGLLVVSMTSMIVADVLYDLLTLHGEYHTGSPLDAGWLVSYVLMATAALYPSRERTPTAAPPPSGSRHLPLVALAGFVSPLILMIATLRGQHVDVTVLSCTSIVLFALVVLRTRWMILRLAAQTRALEVALADRESLEVELRHQAFHDSLTGLPNRALLSDRIAHALAAATRTGSMVAVCLCDLDGFKTINDSLGHPVGDAALVAAGERLSAVARPGDTVARLGGDEFAVLLRDIESPRAASDIGGRIVSALHQPVEVHGRQITLSASVGVAVAGGGSSGERLLSEADSAMYEAKASGKDRCVVFEDAMHVKIVERMELINALPGALERHEFFLEYQPQISLGRRQLEGFEALLRWQHPTLGLIGPDRFVHLAEETGHILPIGRWVIEEACQQAVRWRTGDDRPMSVSVNLSGHQLKDPDLLRCIRTALSLTRLRPEQLVLEITESVLIVDVELTVRALEDLKQLGVRLAIDDFGTGYSSLSYLNRFPIDSIKIDKTFVDPLGDPSSEGTLFVQSIIRLAHDLGLRTVAEGMETVEQRDLLTQLGCDGAQGFLLSRPLSAPAAQDFVVLSGAVASRG
jgi:diguanylate cyclase (GGDEF)-like protein